MMLCGTIINEISTEISSQTEIGQTRAVKGKLKTIALSAAQRAVYEQGFCEGTTHAFRVYCQMILHKSTARASAVLGCCEVVVNNWLESYEAEGIAGLRTKPGRGRKPILDAEQDFARVKEVVKAHRQKLSLAKAELETALAKSFSHKTLERYRKKTDGRYKRI